MATEQDIWTAMRFDAELDKLIAATRTMRAVAARRGKGHADMMAAAALKMEHAKLPRSFLAGALAAALLRLTESTPETALTTGDPDTGTTRRESHDHR